MIEAADQSDGRAEHPRRDAPMRRSTVVALVAGFAIVIWGGYGRHWSRTGINGRSATLWDWLNLLMLPIAVAVLPLWLSRRTRVGKRHKAIGFSLLAAFAVLVVAGYAIPWGWTGFTGNKLWDWLELLVLPLMVAFIPLVLELRDSWATRHALVALTLLVYGGPARRLSRQLGVDRLPRQHPVELASFVAAPVADSVADHRLVTAAGDVGSGHARPGPATRVTAGGQ